MEAIDIALAISLGIDFEPSEESEPPATSVIINPTPDVQIVDSELRNALIKAEAERDIYKGLYEKLLKKAMRE